MNKLFSFGLVLAVISVGLFVAPSAHAAIGFVQPGVSGDTNGLISGLWHGLVAPYALILGLFTNVDIYAHPNAGFAYDAGFLLGVGGSLPAGWILAIISLVLLVV